MSIITQLPYGLKLYIKPGLDLIDGVESFSLHPIEDPVTKATQEITDLGNPGGDIGIALFRTEAEAQAFYNGFEKAGPGDDFTFCTECVVTEEGRTLWAFLCHDGDSDADHCQFENYVTAVSENDLSASTDGGSPRPWNRSANASIVRRPRFPSHPFECQVRDNLSDIVLVAHGRSQAEAEANADAAVANARNGVVKELTEVAEAVRDCFDRNGEFNTVSAPYGTQELRTMAVVVLRRIPGYTDPDAGEPTTEAAAPHSTEAVDFATQVAQIKPDKAVYFKGTALYTYITANSISLTESVNGMHGQRAKNAYERALICLRLLAGAAEWSDGYERRLDDCFEMMDGDDVVRWLVFFATCNARVRRLIAKHRNIGERSLAEWTEKFPDAVTAAKRLG